MDYLKHLLLLALCVYNLQTSDSKNVYTFEVDQPKACGSVANKINIATDYSLHEIDALYVSIALASKRVSFDFGSSQQLINMLLALGAGEMRLGGTSANFLTYIPAASASETPNNCDIDDDKDKSMADEPYASVTASEWVTFNSFLKKANWGLLFDVNNFKWTANGTWDTTNFEQLLNDSAKQGIPIAHFQLGNEPNAYFSNFGVTITAETLAANFKRMKSILSRYPLYANSKICGPDVSNVKWSGHARSYVETFLKSGAYDIIDEICLHQYYFDGPKATLNDHVSAAWMDTLKMLFQSTYQVTNATPRPRPIQLSETATSWGGGSPGISDAFVGGFMWLDKLGLAATLKATRIYRQALVGGSYALFTSSFAPAPDYFLSLLFKTLVEGPVFNITLETKNPQVRLYANCASNRRYAPGALVFYYLNLGDTGTDLSLAQFPDADLDLYMLTPGDDAGLSSKYLKLNGVKLTMIGNQVPPLIAQKHKGDITVQAKTYGFIVVPQANVQFCVNYYARLDSNSQDK